MTISIHTALLTTQAKLAGTTSSPLRESEWLLTHVTGLSSGLLHIHAAQNLTAAQAETLANLTTRRATGEPLAYLLGEQPFWTLDLKVTSSVLIPRPETELLVERALHHIGHDATASVLDLGTGSGAIALAIAKERPQLRVLATDSSLPALEVARSNAALHQLHHVQFLHSNWFDQIPPQTFSVILSNPPYIADNDTHVDPAVRRHEPHSALFSGLDGLNDLRKIINSAAPYLASGGWLALEHGWQQAPAVREMLELAGFTSVASHRDLAGHLRMTEGQRP